MDKYFNLEYRGEGNCAMVFADPQTRQVYRLVKSNATRKVRKLLRASVTNHDEELSHKINMFVRKELEKVISYMNNIMKPLLSSRYVVSPNLKILHKKFGEQAVLLAGEARPAHRKNSPADNVDPDVQCALVLPDCCFVCNSDWNESNAVSSFGNSMHLNSPICQEDLRRSNSCCSADSQESSPIAEHLDDSLDANSSAGDEVDEVDSYSFSSAFYLGNERMEDSSLHICELRDIRDVQDVSEVRSCLDTTNSMAGSVKSEGEPVFTLSIEIKPKKSFMTKSSSDDFNQVCRFCMHQHLKTKSGQWPQTSSYCPLDLFSGNKHRMKHALWSLIKTPQNNLKICKNGKEVYGSEIRQNLSAILSTWFPSNPNRTKKLISVFLDLVIEVLLTRPSTDQNSDPCPAKPGTPVRNFCSQKCDSSSFVYCEDEKSEELPQGCVLEKIYSLQSLDDLDIEGVYPLYKQLKTRMEKEPWLINHWCLNGPYDDVSWLLGRDGEHLSDLDPDSLDYAVLKVKRFLVSKTLQDCSIIAAIQPVTKSIQHKQDFLRFDGDLYNFSVKVIDLDPKPFEKVETYYRQASDIAKTFAETSSAFTKDCDSF
uniref:Inositol-pentakisphosphate 2-kinase n=1 Tax=Biomphalaria glabrata TaxID=6526 RepID=A0A2C9K8I6_BIOGL